MTIEEERRTIHNLVGTRWNIFTFDRVTLYMPTLITKQGAKIPFYTSPTKVKEKAERDSADFRNFIRNNDKNLKLKNYDNDFIAF